MVSPEMIERTQSVLQRRAYEAPDGRWHRQGARAGRGIALLFVFLLAVASWPNWALSSAASRWGGFQAVMWQSKNIGQYQALAKMGFSAALVQADRAAETRASAKQKVSPILQAGLRPYVENIATDFYSAYHRWAPGQPVNAPFLALQKAIAADPGDKTVFIRHPSLSDLRALAEIKRRITKIVRLYAPYRPLFFDLGDEMGIADLSAAWDFDFSPYSLAGMRSWLKRQYGSLAALNSEWGAKFTRWNDVVPPTTTETMMRADENFAAWSDFKTWMDVAFAAAIKTGSDAVHAGAFWALAGMEGAQMPGWGGYDYGRIASAVDVMELYDAGESLELAQTFNPRLTTLMTVDWEDPNAPHRAWREFLRGVRGMIVWDPKDRIVNPDGSLGADGLTASRFLEAMKKSPAALIAASRPVHAPIAVLYSPESYRIQWLLDNRAMGASWTKLGSADQNAADAVRAAQHRVVKLFERIGVSPRFVTDAQIATTLFDRRKFKMIVLPQTLTISRQTAEAIRAFVGAGGVLVTEGQIGTFDEHGRRLADSYLSKLLDAKNRRVVALNTKDEIALSQLEEALKLANVTPEIRIIHSNSASTLEQFVYRSGPLTIVALLSESAKHNEQAGAGNLLSLSRPAYVYDIYAKHLLGHASQFSISAAANTPTVLVISPTPLSVQTCQSILNWRRCPEGE